MTAVYIRAIRSTSSGNRVPWTSGITQRNGAHTSGLVLQEVGNGFPLWGSFAANVDASIVLDNYRMASCVPRWKSACSRVGMTYFTYGHSSFDVFYMTQSPPRIVLASGDEA